MDRQTAERERTFMASRKGNSVENPLINSHVILFRFRDFVILVNGLVYNLGCTNDD